MPIATTTESKFIACSLRNKLVSLTSRKHFQLWMGETKGCVLTKNTPLQTSQQSECQVEDTWLTEASVLATGEGERQAGGEEISLLVPSSPDSSVTGDRRV